MKSRENLLAIVGAGIGGMVGYFAFFWVATQGFYGLILPGGCLGFGAVIFKSKSPAIPVLCSVAALALGLFTEWRFAPFAADDRLGYFLSHAHQLKPITLIMIAAGAFLGFWLPFRRGQEARRV